MPAAVLLTCAPASVTVSPCPAGSAPVATSGYLLSETEASSLFAAAQPFSLAEASAFWLGAFVFILTLYFSSVIYGRFIKLIR